LTAAIVVNDRQLQAAANSKAAVWQPRTADELHNLTALAQAAVGFNTQRGDTVTVEDLAFDDNRPAPPASVTARALNEAENSPVLVKYAVVLMGILVVMAFGVRPALKRATTLAKSESAPPKQLPVNAASQPALNASEPPAVDPERVREQEVFEQVKAHVKNQPTQSSRLLQSWIHSE
jgi:flagellar M-ring protein FliF